MKSKDMQHPTKIALTAVLVLVTGFAPGCKDDTVSDDDERHYDLTTPEGALYALTDHYSRREAAEAIDLLGNSYQFFPALPESIPFLDPADSYWNLETEEDLLNELLDEVQTSWIDQVLLEVHRKERNDLGGGIIEIVAETELGLLIGAYDWQKARSNMVYTYALGGTGQYILIKEEETLHSYEDNGTTVTSLPVSQLKATVMPDEGGSP
jgi:hypothetical protein